MDRIEALEAHNSRAQALQARLDRYGPDNQAAQTGISQIGHIEYKLDCLTEKIDKLIELMQSPDVRGMKNDQN